MRVGKTSHMVADISLRFKRTIEDMKGKKLQESGGMYGTSPFYTTPRSFLPPYHEISLSVSEVLPVPPR